MIEALFHQVVVKIKKDNARKILQCLTYEAAIIIVIILILQNYNGAYFC